MAMLKNLCRVVRNKKGFEVGPEMVMWLPRVVYTVIVIVLTFYIISSFISGTTDVSEVEAKVLINAAHYSRIGVSYADMDAGGGIDTGRVYPGMVNPSKFNSLTLERLFKRERPLLVGRFVRQRTAIDGALSGKFPVAAYTDEARYKLWQPLAQAESKGEGRIGYNSELKYVATSDGSGAVVEATFLSSN